MEEIICIILIFFFLALFLNHSFPLIEGICDSDHEYKQECEEDMPNRPCKDQADYDTKKKAHERNSKKPECQKDLIYEVKGLLDAYSKKDANKVSDAYEKNLQPTEDRFDSTNDQFKEKKAALYDMSSSNEDGGGDGEERDESSVGEIDDPSGAGKSADPDIGKPMDSKGF